MPSATARTRSVTPDGICPFFDFKELDQSQAKVLNDAHVAPDDASTVASIAPAVEPQEDPAPKLAVDATAVKDASAAAPMHEMPEVDLLEAAEAPYDPWNPWGIAAAEPASGPGDGKRAQEVHAEPVAAAAAGPGASEEEGEEAPPDPWSSWAEAAALAEMGAASEWEEAQAAMAMQGRQEPTQEASGWEEQRPAPAAEPAEEHCPAPPAAPVEERYVVTIATYVNVYPLPDDKSTPVLGRFTRNEIVHLFEWDESATWRRCRTKRDDGPPFGWVKVITWKYGPLMVPFKESEKLDQLCKGDASGVLRAVLEDLCEENVQKHVPDMLHDKRSSRLEQLRTARRVRTPGADAPLKVDDGRLVLGFWPRPASKTTFSRVLVMGAHHTCSTALTRELEAQFFVKVENNYDTVVPDNRPENHKHRVMRQPPGPQDALIVCLVKEPCFWLQSLTRAAATYAIHALQELPDGSYVDLERHLGPMEQRSQEELLDGILGPVEFFGDVYPEAGALSVWEASVRSYFDEATYPLWRTAVVRCEDFLFSFDAVMEALAELGLRRRPKAPPPDGRRSKSGVVHFKARNREEALCWYGEEANRHVGLQPRHVQAVSRCLGGLVLGPLGYGDDAVRSWSSRPVRIFIAGSWNKYQPVAMAWNGWGFAHSLQMGQNGRETFQLLLEGSWDSVIYPSIPDASRKEEHEIWGPDDMGHGLNWSIGRGDAAKPGDGCNVRVEVDSSGMPVRVTWEVVPAKR